MMLQFLPKGYLKCLYDKGSTKIKLNDIEANNFSGESKKLLNEQFNEGKEFILRAR